MIQPIFIPTSSGSGKHEEPKCPHCHKELEGCERYAQAYHCENGRAWHPHWGYFVDVHTGTFSQSSLDQFKREFTKSLGTGHAVNDDD